MAGDEGARPSEGEELPIDVSQDLSELTDDRDRGYGFAIEDGDVVQLDPDDDPDAEETART